MEWIGQKWFPILKRLSRKMLFVSCNVFFVHSFFRIKLKTIALAKLLNIHHRRSFACKFQHILQETEFQMCFTIKVALYTIYLDKIVRLSWVSFSNSNVYARNCLSKVINVLCVRACVCCTTRLPFIQWHEGVGVVGGREWMKLLAATIIGVLLEFI